jgi:hypothetical protein
VIGSRQQAASTSKLEAIGVRQHLLFHSIVTIGGKGIKVSFAFFFQLVFNGVIIWAAAFAVVIVANLGEVSKISNNGQYKSNDFTSGTCSRKIK